MQPDRDRSAALGNTRCGRATRLGELLRLYRAAKGVTLRELALDIGIDHTMLSRLERYDAHMRADTFTKILAWLLESDRHQER